MARRGAKPMGEYHGLSAVVSSRMSPETRAALVAAVKEARQKGKRRSLSQELETRLRDSFLEDKRITDDYGSAELYGLSRLIAAVMNLAGECAYDDQGPSSPDDEDDGKRDKHGRVWWLNDPFAYDQATKAAITILKRFRPRGDPQRLTRPNVDASSLLGRALMDAYRDRGVDMASYFLHRIAEAPRALPAPPLSAAAKRISRTDYVPIRIADWLGPLVDRLREDRPPTTPSKRRKK